MLTSDIFVKYSIYNDSDSLQLTPIVVLSFHIYVEQRGDPFLEDTKIDEYELKIVFNLLESSTFFCVILFILIYLDIESIIWIVQKIRNDYRYHSTHSGCRKGSH